MNAIKTEIFVHIYETEKLTQIYFCFPFREFQLNFKK